VIVAIVVAGLQRIDAQEMSCFRRVVMFILRAIQTSSLKVKHRGNREPTTSAVTRHFATLDDYHAATRTLCEVLHRCFHDVLLTILARESGHGWRLPRRAVIMTSSSEANTSSAHINPMMMFSDSFESKQSGTAHI
jgi:hypothetical protein